MNPHKHLFVLFAMQVAAIKELLKKQKEEEERLQREEEERIRKEEEAIRLREEQVLMFIFVI